MTHTQTHSVLKWICLSFNPLKPSGYYTILVCTTTFNTKNSTFCPRSVLTSFVWNSEQTAIISLYNINWLAIVSTCWTWWWPPSRPKHVVLLTTLLQIINCCVLDFLTLHLYVTHITGMAQLKINRLVFINETECVYCAVRTGCLYTSSIKFRL